MVRAYLDFCWVGEGVGGSVVFQTAANIPGYDISGPGSQPNAQTIRFQDQEQVQGTSTTLPTHPVVADFEAAVTLIATNTNAYLVANPQIVQQMQNWAAGGP